MTSSSKNLKKGGVETKLDILYMLAENEENIAKLYYIYADSFPNEKDFWGGLVRDEKHHAAWLKEMAKNAEMGDYFINQKRFTPDAIKTYNKYLKGEIAKAEAGEITLKSALSTALYIEQSLIESKFFSVAQGSAPQLCSMIKQIEQETLEHSKRVKDKLSEYK